MKAKLGFLNKSGTIKVFRKVEEGIELLIDIDGGGTATIVLSSLEVLGILDAVGPIDPAGPKVA